MIIEWTLPLILPVAFLVLVAILIVIAVVAGPDEPKPEVRRREELVNCTCVMGVEAKVYESGGWACQDCQFHGAMRLFKVARRDPMLERQGLSRPVELPEGKKKVAFRDSGMAGTVCSVLDPFGVFLP